MTPLDWLGCKTSTQTYLFDCAYRDMCGYKLGWIRYFECVEKMLDEGKYCRPWSDRVVLFLSLCNRMQRIIIKISYITFVGSLVDNKWAILFLLLSLSVPCENRVDTCNVNCLLEILRDDNLHYMFLRVGWALQKHAYSNILTIWPQKKNENFQIKNSDVFHISAQNIHCGYLLELHQWGIRTAS